MRSTLWITVVWCAVWIAVSKRIAGWITILTINTSRYSLDYRFCAFHFLTTSCHREGLLLLLRKSRDGIKRTLIIHIYFKILTG